MKLFGKKLSIFGEDKNIQKWKTEWRAADGKSIDDILNSESSFSARLTGIPSEVNPGQYSILQMDVVVFNLLSKSSSVYCSVEDFDPEKVEEITDLLKDYAKQKEQITVGGRFDRENKIFSVGYLKISDEEFASRGP